MLQESILQYFQPSLSYHLLLSPLFCLFLGGRFKQVLLYVVETKLQRMHQKSHILYSLALFDTCMHLEDNCF